PENLALELLAPTSLVATWSAVPNADAYLLQRSIEGGAWRTIATLSDPAFVDDCLEPRANVAYRVAVVLDGATSEFSDSVATALPAFATAPLDVPTAFALSQTDVFLSWRRAESGAIYSLERSLDGVEWTSVQSGVDLEFYCDSNLAPNTEYRYRLTVCGANGTSTPTREIRVRTCSDLTPPTAPTATASGAYAIALAWSPSPGAVLYELQSSSEFENWRTIAEVALAPNAESVEYLHSNLTPNVEYSYRVRARNAVGEISLFSPETTAQTAALAPETPTGLEVVPLSSTTLLVAWDVADADSWVVERSADGETWTTIESDCETAYCFDSDLTPLAARFYRVSAVNRAGQSSPTIAVYATTFPAPDAYEPNDDFQDASVATAPANLGLLTGATTLTNLTFVGDDDYFRFEINAPCDATRGATLSCAPGLDAPTLKLYDEDALLLATATNGVVDFDGLAPGVYFLRVCTPDPTVATICSNYSLTFDVPYVPFVKTSPSSVVATSVSTSAIALTWTAAPGATSHILESSDDGTVWRTLATVDDVEEYADDGLEPNATRWYRVVARYSGDANDYVSSAVSATTWIADDDLLPNDSRAAVDAQVYSYANGGVVGELTQRAEYEKLALPVGDEDWFAFDLTSRRVDASIVATFDASDAPLALQLYSSNDVLQRSATVSGATATLGLDALPAGR
ncbi:MAG: fibronectin type III domain-containing protein, partial [Thermoguttaceae bacterium]|nr:fibronectin type III domain-containing protein [Thermoguttaceae bacterium]